MSTSSWTLAAVARAATIAAIAAGTGAALGYLVAHEPAPPPRRQAPPAAAPAPELALLAPLREGGALGGFDVAEIHPIGDDGVLRLVCRKRRSAVRLAVALATDGGAPPAATAGRYAVYFTLENGDPADGERLASALAAVLQANAAVPVPPGLGGLTGGR